MADTRGMKSDKDQIQSDSIGVRDNELNAGSNDTEAMGPIAQGNGYEPAQYTRKAPNESETEPLNLRYKVQHINAFKIGKVFKILWTEPKGAAGSTMVDKHHSLYDVEKQGFAKIRRFVGVQGGNGHCLCLPIMTYGTRGTREPGISTHDHAILYTRDGPQKAPQYQHRLKVSSKYGADLERKWENEGEFQEPSHLNYAKIYTVENNVKAHFIGQTEDKAQNDYNFKIEQWETSGTDGRAAYYDEMGSKIVMCLDHCASTRERKKLPQIISMIGGSPIALAMIASCSGLLMAATFLWLNKSMGLHPSSRAMNMVTSYLPGFGSKTDMLKSTKSPPNGVIFSTFILSTAMFTASTVSWAVNGTQKMSLKVVGWVVIMIGLVLWMVVGFNAEELALVCVPLNVIIGIWVSCCGKIERINPPQTSLAINMTATQTNESDATTRVKCFYPNCDAVFGRIQEMERHMDENIEHHTK